MNEYLSKMRKKGQLPILAQDIDIKEFDRSKSKFTICQQKEMNVTIYQAEKIKQEEWNVA